MAHDPSLAYADYFAAGGGGSVGGVGTLVPEVDAVEDEGHHHHLYDGGVHAHHHGLVDMFGGAMAAGADAHGKAAAALGDFAGLGGHHHHRLGGHGQPPLTSLSLHGPAEAASLALHQHHHHQQLGGGLIKQQQQHQLVAAWPPPPLQQQQGAWHLRASRFLRPTQQLLQEFCGLPVETAGTASAPKPPTATKPASEDGGGEGASSSPAPSAQIQAMDTAELQRLKAKLYTMLQEVERRYRRYREQMKAVAGSFEAVAGERAAAPYTRLASRTISKHFRSLRDGVAAQMQAVRRALGEKDADGGGPAAGMVKGETTPRLRVLDQCLRQHRAYQAGVLESQPWRPQRGLPERAVSILRAWLFEHFLHPYPSDVDKHILARQTGLSRSQVSNWFINARVRLWKPMVEEMYTEEMKDPQQQEGGGACSNANNPSPYGASAELGHAQGRGGGGEDGGERKPTRAQLVHDAGSLASVVSIGSSSSRDPLNINFGMMDGGHLDFGAYNDDGQHAAGGAGHGFGGGSGVSLTLGLQQHAGDDPHGGVNVAFAAAPSAAHEFLFMAGGEHQQQMVVAGGGVHGHQQGQFGAGMEGDAVATSHYHRGLSAATGFQLMHDLAG